MPCTATGPCASSSRTGVPTEEASVRMKTPAASISRELNPSRWAESWLPLVGQPDRVDVGERAVVDVPGNHHEVHALRGHHVEQVVHVGSLVREHALPVEGPPEVPVGGVEDAHTTNLEGGADSPAYPRRRPAQV